MKKILVAVAAVASISGAFAQTNSTGYWRDSGGTIVRNPYGDCWRSGYWTPALGVAECEPGMVKPMAAPTPVPAPVPVVAPKPAPAPVVQETPKPRAAAPIPAPIPVPIPVVVAPPPPPAPVVAPKPAPAKKIALSGSTSFAIGKADLTAEGKAAVDKEVISKLSGFSKIEKVTIDGHADPMGKEESNIKLSKSRAEAVKAYMVSKGIKADVIVATGKGSSEPVEGVKCDPKLGKAKLTACYAPHRRIEVDVAGEAK